MLVTADCSLLPPSSPSDSLSIDPFLSLFPSLSLCFLELAGLVGSVAGNSRKLEKMAEKMASSSLFDEDDHHHHHHHHQQQQKQGGGGAGAPPPWLTVNLSDPARALEEDRQRWCTCSRNPSSCVIHASAAAQWLSPGVGSIENGSRVPLQRDSSETLTNMTGGGVPGGGGGGPRSGPPGQFLVDLQHSVDTAHSDLVEDEGGAGQIVWKGARMKADILGHPLYEQLLSAHVGCLRIATPVHHLPRIDAQLADAQHVVAKYSLLANGAFPVDAEQDKDELDQFMTHYVLLLCSFKEHLQQHVRVHAMEAVMACWELEQSLLALTGVAPEEGNGDTMSDDEDELDDEGAGFYDLGFDGHDNGGFGPLIPTETERSLMERVRQELKTELKQGYKERIVDVREEILRKRRAGKLPGDSTSVLKTWWDSHSKWPYPTEDEKARLVQETGLQLKQINNWFINQRKRNWHSNPSASLKNKRKRC